MTRNTNLLMHTGNVPIRFRNNEATHGHGVIRSIGILHLYPPPNPRWIEAQGNKGEVGFNNCGLLSFESATLMFNIFTQRKMILFRFTRVYKLAHNLIDNYLYLDLAKIDGQRYRAQYAVLVSH